MGVTCPPAAALVCVIWHMISMWQCPCTCICFYKSCMWSAITTVHGPLCFNLFFSFLFSHINETCNKMYCFDIFRLWCKLVLPLSILDLVNVLLFIVYTVNVSFYGQLQICYPRKLTDDIGTFLNKCFILGRFNSVLFPIIQLNMGTEWRKIKWISYEICSWKLWVFGLCCCL